MSGPNEKLEARDKILRPLLVMLVLAVVLGLFFFQKTHPDIVDEWKNYGYLGAFLASLIANASIILPIPGLLIIFSLGGILNPLLLGLSSGIAAAIGETTGYLAGYSGQAIAKRSEKYETMVTLTKKWGTLAVFIFTLIPFLPFDIVGITAGILRFRFWKYFLICWVGRTMLYAFVAWAGALGWDAISKWFH